MRESAALQQNQTALELFSFLPQMLNIMIYSCKPKALKFTPTFWWMVYK